MTAGEGVRSFEIVPIPDEWAVERWVLKLFEDGDECGGGSYPSALDGDDFDTGFDDANEAGCAWAGVSGAFA